jgi:hypothetical protein
LKNLMSENIFSIRHSQVKAQIESVRSALRAAGIPAVAFAAIDSLEEPVKRLLRDGPTGWGPLPHGSVRVEGKQYVTKSQWVDRWYADTETVLWEVKRWEAHWRHAKQIKPGSVELLQQFDLWKVEISLNEFVHPCWFADDRKCDMRISSRSGLIIYVYARVLGCPANALLDAAVAGLINGYWPIGFDKGQTILWADDGKVIGSKSAPRAKRRSSAQGKERG